MTKKNILLIGFGPHAKRIYYPVSKRDGQLHKFRIVCAVDLSQKKKEIETYLSNNNASELDVFYIAKKHQTIGNIPLEVTNSLDTIVDKYNIKGVIISTEPRVHMQYARWALSKRLSVLLDKPITIHNDISVDPLIPKKVIHDYNELNKLYNKAKNTDKNINCSVMTQRRFHPAYIKIKSLIQHIHNETNCPITSIQSFHADGQWRLPHEIENIDYHGYNQGFGKSAHSGYHFYDIISWLLEAGENDDKYIDNVDIFTNVVRPNDFLRQLTSSDYKKIFPDFQFENNVSHRKMINYGEIDSFCSLAFKNKEHVLSLGTVNLAHNSYSQRGWACANGRDLYKGNGRVRHETHTISQGPFQTISFQSFQSKEVDPKDNISSYNTGGEFHLDIHVFRNSAYNARWKTYQKFSLRELFSSHSMSDHSRGHQEDARRLAILEFIASLHGNTTALTSDLSSHQRSTLLFAGVYQAMANRHSGHNPVVNMEFNKSN